MRKPELWVRGGQTHRQTGTHINTMNWPGLGEGPSEKKHQNGQVRWPLNSNMHSIYLTGQLFYIQCCD